MVSPNFYLSFRAQRGISQFCKVWDVSLDMAKTKIMIQQLRIAIQKSGRLYDDSISLLKECGIDLRNVKDRLKTESDNFPLEVFFLRDDDIPQYVYDGVADIGIVGENVLLEKAKDIDLIFRLGFGKCRLSIARTRGFSSGRMGAPKQ